MTPLPNCPKTTAKRHVRDVADKHDAYLGTFLSEDDVHQRLSELNVIEQVNNVCRTTVDQDVWARAQLVTDAWLDVWLVRRACCAIWAWPPAATTTARAAGRGLRAVWQSAFASGRLLRRCPHGPFPPPMSALQSICKRAHVRQCCLAALNLELEGYTAGVLEIERRFRNMVDCRVNRKPFSRGAR
ncbi:hypothetical protein D9M68_103410 [compost metagenome]